MKKICFYNLDAFATTGGIEKFNRALLFALNKFGDDKYMDVHAASMYDNSPNNQYFPENKYRYYSKNKIFFVLNELLHAYQYDVIILGHINLSLFGLLVHYIFPPKKIFLIAHGIEIWKKQVGVKAKMLEKAYQILAVSQYTKKRIVEINNICDEKVKIFYNTIDPYFKFPSSFVKPIKLLNKHNIALNSKIVFSLARLKYTEKYKGYDRIIEILPTLLHQFPNLVYILAGKSDDFEMSRLQGLINKHGVSKHVLFLGYIPDEEIVDYYQLADCFVMPSQKEGFGIVFIEAMACGLPVIAGNKDGSVDALDGGNFGTLVNPDSNSDILQAILKILGSSDPQRSGIKLQKNVIDKFGFNRFYENLNILVNE